MRQRRPIHTQNVMAMTTTRALVILGIFAAAFFAVAVKLCVMMIAQYDEYQSDVIDQITVGGNLTADRGTIYDANGNVIAGNRTVYRIFISPRDIYNASKEDDKKYDEVIANGLSSILGPDYAVTYEDVYSRAQYLILDEETGEYKVRPSGALDQTVKREVDVNTAERIIAFAEENGLSTMIHTEASTTRYYPYGDFASHVLGFTGSDNQGLFGLEYYYDEELTGTDGKYVTAIDSYGNEMPYEYSNYIPPVSGNSIVTTLDPYIQRELELQLQQTLADSEAGNRVGGIVMDVNTGAILAMAVAPSFDPNDPYTLDELSERKLAESGYAVGTEEYNSYKTSLLYSMWNNKTVSEVYEPGSTFKVITSAMVLDAGVSTFSHRYDCIGYWRVGGYNISCHKHTGHGTGITFAYGLQQSCNPTMMQVAAKLGSSSFYRYFDSFGYLSKTGIDLPSEANSIMHAESSIGATELATASFGQRFKVSMIQQVTAIATIANGGYLVTPHLLSSILDENGNTIYTYTTSVKRQVVSTSVCKQINQVLEEGVSGNGAAKNAYVMGYKVAAKTGTSEKFDILDENGNSYLRIGSCVAYAPADNPSIVTLIVVDEPMIANIYGSVVAAPYVAGLLKNVLPYLGYEPTYSTEDLNSLTVSVGSYVGTGVDTAKKRIESLGMECKVIGNGSVVTAQSPSVGSSLISSMGTVYLYTDYTEEEEVVVPDVVGMSASLANQTLLSYGLNIAIEGTTNYELGDGAQATVQSIPKGTKVKRGTVVTVTFIYTDGTD